MDEGVKKIRERVEWKDFQGKVLQEKDLQKDLQKLETQSKEERGKKRSRGKLRITSLGENNQKDKTGPTSIKKQIQHE